MNRIILIVLVGIVILGLTCAPALAEEEKLSLSATASSSAGIGSTPEKAIDGVMYSYWTGAQGAAPWWITFDAGSIKKITRIEIYWIAFSFTPLAYDVQLSADGHNWENFASGLGKANGKHYQLTIERRTRYIRLYIHKVVWFAPILKEFTAYGPTIPHLIRFQGWLKDTQGALLNGSFTLKFKLYDVDTAGTPLWEETQENVTIEDGLLDVELGSVTAFNLPFDQQYWLGVEVGSDGEMTPRFKLTTVPYAFTSEK